MQRRFNRFNFRYSEAVNTAAIILDQTLLLLMRKATLILALFFALSVWTVRPITAGS